MKAWIARGWKACGKQRATVVLTLALTASFLVYNSFAPVRAGFVQCRYRWTTARSAHCSRSTRRWKLWPPA